MASIGQVRGAILEEIVLCFLARSGYEIVGDGAAGLRRRGNGQELQGRGCWHQIDAIAIPKYSPAFIYPVRLLVEAKCYEDRPVDIKTLRAVVGIVMDVSQNYFIPQGRVAMHVQRYNYAAAVFSTSGFTEDAQRFAIAHQVFLIEYGDLPLLRPIIQSLLRLTAEDFGAARRDSNIRIDLGAVRTAFRTFLEVGDEADLRRVVLPDTARKLVPLRPAVRDVPAIYNGMIGGVYPIQLFGAVPVGRELLRGQRTIPCRIRVRGHVWAFEPSGHDENAQLYFRLEFQLPSIVAETAAERENDWRDLVELKQRYLRYVDVTGVVGERTVVFRLTLDEDWLRRYAEQKARREREHRLRPR